MGPFGKWQFSKSVVHAFYTCLHIYLGSLFQTASIRIELPYWGFTLPAVFCSCGQRKEQNIHEMKSSWNDTLVMEMSSQSFLMTDLSHEQQSSVISKSLQPTSVGGEGTPDRVVPFLGLPGYPAPTEGSSCTASTAAHFVKPWVESRLGK